VDDFDFNEYKENNKRMYAAIIVMSLFGSFHVFRMFYSKVFLLPGFKASATNCTTFLKPLIFYSRLYCVLVLIPLILLNSIGAIVAKQAFGTN